MSAGWGGGVFYLLAFQFIGTVVLLFLIQLMYNFGVIQIINKLSNDTNPECNLCDIFVFYTSMTYFCI